MSAFEIKCRAINIEHSCTYGGSAEPVHPPTLVRFLQEATDVSKVMEFCGRISSGANNYQINLDFDSRWIDHIIKYTSWSLAPPLNVAKLKQIPDIKLDGLLASGDCKIVIEVEKSNKKTIWFDFMKMMMMLGTEEAQFGVLLVPRNYAHRRGIWDLFKEARFYRWCLSQFARVDETLMSKLAIIGYTQEALVNGSWKPLSPLRISLIKNKAKTIFDKSR